MFLHKVSARDIEEKQELFFNAGYVVVRAVYKVDGVLHIACEDEEYIFTIVVDDTMPLTVCRYLS
ncbi:hypothetical protein EKK58_11870 [Candidatus Dependentiae bacterium]|nr:MAG: hypothetical protein EKK58_11870 [Candidatus Dependentiae bacterium]